jgi:hypothetical protein
VTATFPAGRPNHDWAAVTEGQGNLKVEMDFKERGCEGVESIQATHTTKKKKSPEYYLKLNYSRFRNLTNHPLIQRCMIDLLNKP